MKLTAQLGGVADLRRRLADVTAQLRDGLPRARERAAEAVAQVARAQTAPRWSGRLAEQTSAQDGTVISATDYAPYVNARDPYVARAVDAAQADIVRVYADEVDGLLS